MKQNSAAGGQPSLRAAGSEKGHVSSWATEENPLRDYWAVVVKRCRLMILLFLVVFGVGAYCTLSASPLYFASTTIKIEPQNPMVTGLVETLPSQIGSASPYDYYKTQFALLESRALMAMVISDLKLGSAPAFINARVIGANPLERIVSKVSGLLQKFVRAEEVSRKRETSSDGKKDARHEDRQVLNNLDSRMNLGLVERYRSFLKVKPVKNTHLVEVQFTTPDPELSQQLANAHATNFIRTTVQTRFDLTLEARQFLDNKNAELKKELEKSEAALNQFRQIHGVVSLEKGENVVVDRLVELNKVLTAAKAQRIEAESLHRTVQNKDSQSLSQVMKEGLVPTLRGNLATLEVERTKLSTTFKPDHPRMLELHQQIREARRSINSEIANVVWEIQANYAAALDKEKALQAEADRQQQKALNLKHVGVEYAVLEEEVKVNRGLYESILKRLNDTHVMNDLTLSNMQVVERAQIPISPTYPKTTRNLLISAALGLLLGGGFVFGLEHLDSSVNTPQQVWRAVALNTFGAVPALNSLHRSPFGWNGSARPLLKGLTRLRLPASSAPSSELFMTDSPHSIIADSYRTIRTAFLFSQAKKPPQIALLTSPSPRDGKTVTTLNLATALAQDGHRVLIIDADLRNGCCHTRLKLANHEGLSNVLKGNLKLEQAIQATRINSLFLLSSGIRPPNPSELLGSHKMREMLSSLRESFNFVLIDCPPTIAVTDAAILSMVSDGVILVFRAQKTTMRSARQALERLNAIRAPILGVVLNGVDLADPEYAYYRDYFGSDHYALGAHQAKDGGEITIETSYAHRPEVARFRRWLSIEDAKIVTSSDDRSDIGISPEKLGPGTVPRDFFDDMTWKLSEVVGPMATGIIRDHIDGLGESLESFPKTRLKELLELICTDILNENLRAKFRQTILSEIRPLEELRKELVRSSLLSNIALRQATSATNPKSENRNPKQT